MVIYLCGSIRGRDFDDANAWRKKATDFLEWNGHEVINPLRGRVWSKAEEQSQFTPNEIIHRDLKDVDKSDILLVEYTNPSLDYVGTITEMARARRKDKIVIVFTEGKRSTFGWLDWYLATKVVNTLEEALDYIVSVLP